MRGRPAFRIVVEDCLALDLAEPATREGLPPKAYRSSSWRWSSHGRETASIGYDWSANAQPDETGRVGTLALGYHRNGEPVRQTITLIATRPHFGGARWWFVCPLAERAGKISKVRTLYLPPGAKLWGSRKAYGLSYQSQRDCGLERSIRTRAGGNDEMEGLIRDIASVKEEGHWFARIQAKHRRNAIRRIRRKQAG